MLGGQVIDPQTTSLNERRLLNVVEEMALAAGIHVPPVYVLENEAGINAFAAGRNPNDAVVAVSCGCLDYLTREELQGVIAHEFSHILNGDMRLNLRLIGIVHGILVLSIIGYYLIRTGGYSSWSSDRDGKRSGSGYMLIGVALSFWDIWVYSWGKSSRAQFRGSGNSSPTPRPSSSHATRAELAGR